MTATLLPLRSVIEVLDDELTAADEQFVTLAEEDPCRQALMTLPSIGPITATAFMAALDDVARSTARRRLTSYLGLVPREYSSGEHQHRGRIVRSAHPHVQSLLVQAAWRMSRSSDAKTAGLRAWADAITRRRGKKVAMVASRDASPGSCLRCGEIKPSIRRRVCGSFVPRRRQVSKARPRRPRVTGEVVKLEEQARVGVWPLLRAVPQRALLLLRTLLCAGTLSATRERELKG